MFSSELARVRSTLEEVLKRTPEESGDLQPISMDEVLESISSIVGGRTVRRLTNIWTTDPGVPCEVRLRGLAISLDLKQHFQPKQTVFQDSAFSDDEEQYLQGQEVTTCTENDYCSLSENPPAESEVDIFYTTHCNYAIINNLFWSHWNEVWLKRVIFISDALDPFLGEMDYLNYVYTTFELAELFTYHIPEANTTYRPGRYLIRSYTLNAGNVPSNLPKPKYHWNLIPSHMRSLSTGGLVEMNNFAQITDNLHKIQEKLQQEGFLDEVAQSVKDCLQTRKLKRIALVGLGYFAFKFAMYYTKVTGLQQLALTLALGKHFKVAVSCHEPILTQFEREYLNSLGVATPPVSDMSSPEEGLEGDEATLFYMPRCCKDLVSMVIWANRRQMRRMLLMGARCSGQSWFTENYCKAAIAYYEKAEIIPVRNINLGFRKSANQANDGLSAFDETVISSYPADVLPGVSDEKPKEFRDEI